MYSLLTLIVVSFLLGMILGFWVLTNAINRHVEDGDMEIYVEGRRLPHYRLF